MIEVDQDPDAGKIRRFGLGLILFGLALGAVELRRGRPAPALALAAAGILLGAACALAPESFGRGVFRAWMGAARPIGKAASFLILATIYFGVLTPLAMAMRLSGRDPLRLRRPPPGSFWTEFRDDQKPAGLEKLY